MEPGSASSSPSAAADVDPKTVAAGYDRWASLYDHDGNPMQGLEQPLVWDAAGDVAGLTLLDLGCGTGRHALRFAAAGAVVTAVDFSAGMLDEARRKPHADRVSFQQRDLQEPLPFAAAAFDLAVSGLVLEHLPDPSAFFREMRRVLKRGGRAIVSNMHPAMFLRDAQAQFTDPATGLRVRPGSLRHSVSDLLMAALRAGFSLEEVSEHAPDESFAEGFPRAAKYVGWPMLVLLKLRA